MIDATNEPTEDGAKDAIQGIRQITAGVDEINKSIPSQKLNETERKQVQAAVLHVAHGISQTLHGIDGMTARLSEPNSEAKVDECKEDIEDEPQTETSTAEPHTEVSPRSNGFALVALTCVAAIAGLSVMISVAVLSVTALSVGVYALAKLLFT